MMSQNYKKKIKYFALFLAAVAVGFLIANQKRIVSIKNPTPTLTDSWELSATENEETFKYPSDLSTKYIMPSDWPPVLNVYNETFTCNQAGKETERAGETKLETIAGHEYCVTRVTEGAAGSSYTQYAYARAANDKTEILTFSLRFVQCGNYDEALMSECEVERAAFDIGPTVDEIFNTIKK